MKKKISLLLALALTLSLPACAQQPAQETTQSPAPAAVDAAEEAPAGSEKAAFTAGTYTASAQGRNGLVEVEVTFDENSILDAKVLSAKETKNIGTVALEEIPAGLVEKQHLPDVVSGATQSSVAVRAALTDCMEQAGGDVAALTSREIPQPVEEADVFCDVVVVGAGTAGLSEAIGLRKLGKNVILVEKEGILGGTSLTASSYIAGWGTSVHEKAGVQLTAQEYYDSHYVSAGLREAAPDMAMKFVEMTPTVMEELMEYGADLSNLIDGQVQMGPADGSTIGGTVMPALIKEAQELGVDIRLKTKATSILTENGAACGVTVDTAGGTYQIHAGAVVIATGGYFQNKEMVKQYTPQYADYGTTWSVGSTGDGLVMCMELGATLNNMESPVINPTGFAVPQADNMISFSNMRYYGCILVGQSTGTRFQNELGDYTLIASSMPEGKAYVIFDDKVYQASSAIREYDDLGYFTKASTVAELAEELGLDPNVLENTVATYTKYAQNGLDEEFGRPLFPSDLTAPPYYAAPVSPALHSAVGGVVTDARGQALYEDGTPIGGLYVVGNASDNGLQPNGMSSTVYARVIAQCIAEDLG